jgi:tetratricopeptide (TPR) repeat protein
MLARVVTWIFYAVVFFMLGVWAGPRLHGLPSLTDQAAGYGAQGWNWLFSSGTQPPEVTPPPAVPAPYDTALAAARDAYQRGDLSAAIAAYRALIAAHPEGREARGELGNVLYESGQLREAAQVFFDLAAGQLDRGDASIARQLEPAIRRGDPRLADELLNRLGTGAPQTGLP